MPLNKETKPPYDGRIRYHILNMNFLSVEIDYDNTFYYCVNSHIVTF